MNAKNFFSVSNMAEHFSLSIEIGEAMTKELMNAFEKELLIQSVIKRVQPYAFQYSLSAAYTLGMHDVQTADPRADDEFLRQESIEEPVISFC